MNERIKELAEQATKRVTKPDGHYIVQEWQKVFAELIVNECYNRAESQYHHSSDEWDKGVMAVMNSIEELFGS